MIKKIIKLAIIIFCCYETSNAFTIKEAIQRAIIDSNILLKIYKETGNFKSFQEYINIIEEQNHIIMLNMPDTDTGYTPMSIKDIVDIQNLTINILHIMLTCAKQASIIIDDIKAWDYLVKLMFDYLHHVLIKYTILNTNFTPQLNLIQHIKNVEEYISAIKNMLNPAKDEAVKRRLDGLFAEFKEKKEMFKLSFESLSKVIKGKKHIRKDVHRAMKLALFS